MYVWYNVGDTVTYNGVTHQTIQAHTSQVGREPSNVPALWGTINGPTNTLTRTPTKISTTCRLSCVSLKLPPYFGGFTTPVIAERSVPSGAMTPLGTDVDGHSSFRRGKIIRGIPWKEVMT